MKKYRVAQRSLTLLDLKGYVGGLFLFDGRLLHIGSLGFSDPMMRVSASLFDGLRSFGTMCIRQKVSFVP